MENPVEFVDFFTFHDTTLNDVFVLETALYNKKMACDVHLLGNVHMTYANKNITFIFQPWAIEENKAKKIVTFTRKVTIIN